MKKITLLFSFIACVVFAQAQELVVNGGFESWTNSTTPAANWTPTVQIGQSFTKDSVIIHSGSYSVKSVSNSTAGTAKLITKPYITVTGGQTYTFSFWYYADAATTNLTGAIRMWGYWENPDGSNNTTFDQSGLQPASYIDLTSTVGTWQKFSVDITAPALAGQLELDIRIYKNSTLYIDDVSLTPKTATSLSSPKADALKVSLIGSTLSVENAADGSIVDIYSSIGAKVQSSRLQNSAIQLNGLSKGLYIVRIGNQSSKIMM